MNRSIKLFSIITLLFIYYLHNNNETFIAPETVYKYDKNKPLAIMNYNYSRGLYNSYGIITLNANNIRFNFIISTSMNKSFLSDRVKKKIDTDKSTISFKTHNCSLKNPLSFNVDNTSYRILPDYSEGLLGTDNLSNYVIRVFKLLDQIALYDPCLLYTSDAADE